MEDLNQPITVQEAIEALSSSCYYTNDNADTVGIGDVKTCDSPNQFIVYFYHGCNITKQGNPQGFRITVEKLPETQN